MTTLAYATNVPLPTDAPSTFPEGFTVYNVSTDDDEAWPGEGTLVVFNANATNGVTQVLLTFGRVYVRHTSASVWGSWTELATV